MTLTIPTLLTLFRIVLIPVLVLVFYWNHPWSNVIATAVFVLGALTDWLDGWVARRYDMYSAFGAFLDPVADKLAVTIALFLVVQWHHTVPIALLGAVIVGREITISALREWMAQMGAHGLVKVAGLGKIKTIVQMVAISCLIFREPLLGLPIFWIGEWLLGMAAALTLWSGFDYMRAAWPTMRKG
ncbi:MAG TPA: CDP-diacylglycerol--glycerol-3-phosphate 3-phosphatidyltransferase [Arenimonas sp.]|uniref:CDP-diacylglycerol--glycerol-3-phosphate 3-phosphatidyltransferase n=1 Tax=Arenimonas sp. TaxID=1872635 RepID=UPI002D0679E3|nr:CDP-diacylglycerol--glycerol-3-phosphate 3-phosphatidyltransferase [Arenimonas sp.]HMB57309.1 CDP-diacylglycerol--glycerol-3-phosphate 3-phosphatidyltransferase [Arenimonas sp.]